MARLILDTDDTMTIETAIVAEEIVIEQALLMHLAVPIAVESHGETIMQEQARPEGWVAGEDALAAALADIGALTLQDVTPTAGSREGLAVYAKGRKWFGGARALGMQAAERFPSGVQRLRLVPPGTYGADVHGVELT